MDASTSGLRRRNVSSSGGQTVERIERFDIYVVRRPVQGVLGYAATHVYLALCDSGTLKVADTLSFDPSNSKGWNDADPLQNLKPENCELVEKSCVMDIWKNLSVEFQAKARASAYHLGSHNCCHAVMDALTQTNLACSRNGIRFADEANKAWQAINRNASGDQHYKDQV